MYVFAIKGTHLLGGCLGPGILDCSRSGEPFEGVAVCTLLGNGRSCSSACIWNFEASF